MSREDTADPTDVIFRRLAAHERDNLPLLSLARLIKSDLSGEHLLRHCETWWGAPGDHPPHGTHRCGLLVGHPGRHTCTVWRCRSWRNPGDVG